MHLLPNYDDDDDGGGTDCPHVRHSTGEFDRSVVLLVWVAGVREGLSTFGGFGRSLCVLNWPETSVQDLKQEDEIHFYSIFLFGWPTLVMWSRALVPSCVRHCLGRSVSDCKPTFLKRWTQTTLRISSRKAPEVVLGQWLPWAHRIIVQRQKDGFLSRFNVEAWPSLETCTRLNLDLSLWPVFTNSYVIVRACRIGVLWLLPNPL